MTKCCVFTRNVRHVPVHRFFNEVLFARWALHAQNVAYFPIWDWTAAVDKEASERDDDDDAGSDASGEAVPVVGRDKGDKPPTGGGRGRSGRAPPLAKGKQAKGKGDAPPDDSEGCDAGSAVDFGEKDARTTAGKPGTAGGRAAPRTTPGPQAARKALGEQVQRAKKKEKGAVVKVKKQKGQGGDSRGRSRYQPVNYHVNKDIEGTNFFVSKRTQQKCKLNKKENARHYKRRQTLREHLQQNGFYCSMFLGNGGKQNEEDEGLRACLRGTCLHHTYVRTCVRTCLTTTRKKKTIAPFPSFAGRGNVVRRCRVQM